MYTTACCYRTSRDTTLSSHSYCVHNPLGAVVRDEANDGVVYLRHDRTARVIPQHATHVTHAVHYCGHKRCDIRSSYSSMSKALYGPTAVLPVIMIGVMMMMMMMSLGVSAQPTVNDDDEAYCQSGTFEGFVNEIRADIKTSARDVKQMKEQLAQVKTLLGSRQREENETKTAFETARDVRQIKEQLTEVKNLLGSRQQPCEFRGSDSSTLCECKTRSLLICRRSMISDWYICGIP